MSELLTEFNLISGSGLGKWSGTPVIWDTEKNLLTINRPFFKTGCVFFFYLVATLVWRAASSYFSSKYNEGHGDPYITFVIVLVCTNSSLVGFTLEVSQRPDPLQQFFSELARMSERSRRLMRGKGPLSLGATRLAKLAGLTCRVVRLSTATLIPVVTSAISVFLPEFPVNMVGFGPARMLLDGMAGVDGPWHWIGVGLGKMVTFVCNYFGYDLMAKTWAVFVSHTVIGCTGLTSEILGFHLQFQNGIRKDSSGDEGWLLRYRKMVLLSNIFNGIESRVLFVLSFAMICMQIQVGCYLLKATAELGIIVAVFNVISLVNTMMALFILLSFCARFYATSSDCLMKVRNVGAEIVMGNRSYRELRKYRRLVKSLPVLKVEFGAANFVDRLTPAIFQNFTVLRLVDCLLVSKR